MIRLAVSQYQIEKLHDWNTYKDKMTALIKNAKCNGVDLVVLPEYAGIEIVCSYFDTEFELFEAIQPLIPQFLQFFQDLATKEKIYIQTGTIIEKINSKHFANRAYFFSPDNSYGYQDKLQLTEYEKSIKLLAKGERQTVFDCPFGKVGIAICYDSEFPEIVRRLVLAGATIILVPSYTTTMAGYYRVSLSCRARAIENQCYVAVSFIVKDVNISVESELTFGQAAIFSPADNGFPDDGVLTQGHLNEVRMVQAELSMEKLSQIRTAAQVLNFQDMQNSLYSDYEVEIKYF